jgi:PAS domain S-box-containing protein
LYGLKKDGSEFPIEIGLNPIETDEGKMVLSAIVDISSRKKLEERFRQVVESAPNAMVMIGPNGKIEMVNAQAERLFGYERAEMLGQNIELLIPARFKENHPKLRTGYFNNPESRPMGAGRDLYGLKKDGSEFPIEIGLNPIETDEGKMVLSAIVDISSRKKLEERFRQVVESAPNAMVMIGPNGKIEMVNAQAERLFGYERAEMLGQNIELLIPQRFKGNHPKLRDGYFRKPESRPMGVGRDLYGMKKDGSEFPIEIGLNPIETDEGKMVLSAIVDISDRKQKEARIHAALAEKDILLGEIHHRVKNNLQVVNSLLDLQIDRITDVAVLDMLRESQKPHQIHGPDPPDALRVQGLRAGGFQQLPRHHGADACGVLRRRRGPYSAVDRGGRSAVADSRRHSLRPGGQRVDFQRPQTRVSRRGRRRN